MRWVRPLHSIVALLGEAIVPVAIDGVTCGATTLGHRFHHPGIITIGSAADYVEKLRACHVIVDQAERRQIIALGATMAACLSAARNSSNLERHDFAAEHAQDRVQWPHPLERL